MKTVLTAVLELDGNSYNLFLTEPTSRAYVAEVHAKQEAARAAAAEEQAALKHTYHLGDKPTPGRGYDDRLKMRLGCGADKARELVASGQIAYVFIGNRYSICEQAVRDFYGTTRKAA